MLHTWENRVIDGEVEKVNEIQNDGAKKHIEKRTETIVQAYW